ncbi:MAG: molybdate ABC transporter substrate-binding protein [Chloroflexota bacterium]|nr:molybdate ABC transporter substrate-binding protein [Chloroflexota bacterium]
MDRQRCSSGSSSFWKGPAVGVLILSTALVAACASPVPLRSGPPAGELTVFAAASLRDAFEEAAVAYHAETGTAIVLSFDASSALRAQIEQGAPADVFASADTRNAAVLAEAGLIDGAPIDFAANLLTIIVPAGNPAAIESPADLAREGVSIVAAGDEVPITGYAVEVVGNLGDLDGYPPGFAEAVHANIVSREDNVRAVVAKIALGEGDAGIVYLTDASSAGDAVVSIAIPEEANVPATYTAGVVGAAQQTAEGHAFLDWLTGPDGQAILMDHGFVPAP